MRLGTVIGRVTLSRQDPSFQGGRYLLVLPWVPPPGRSQPRLTQPLPSGSSLVVFDNLGAGQGDVIGYSESGEAAAAFSKPTPVDALNCILIDEIIYQPATSTP